MAKKQQQTRWTLIVMGYLIAIVAVVWSWSSLAGSRQELVDAVESQRKCAELCNSIASVSGNSSRKNWMMPAEFRPGPQITDALARAGITIPKLFVSSSGGRSLPGATFSEQTVEMPDLIGMELPPIIRFLHNLASGERVFQINRVTLDAVDRTFPYSETSLPPQHWNASIDVSYFVESGQRASSRNR